MKQLGLFFCIAALLYPLRGLAAEQAAPFGLRWGMSQAEVEALGVTKGAKQEGQYGNGFEAKNLPKVLNDTRTVLLFFGFDDRLWRIVAGSTQWEHDRTGAQATARFDELSKLLSERYGRSNVHMNAPKNEYEGASDRFAMSLSDGTRQVFADWNTPDVGVQLSLRSNFDSTFYVLIYEYKPLLEGVRQGVRAKEKGAL